MKKKILSLLLVFVMLTSMLPMSVFAADCDHSNVSYWNQTYDGTNRHSGYCYSCYSTVYADCDTNGYKADYSGHYQACSVCGRKASTTATAHSWAYEVGSYGAGYHKQFCSVCGYVNGSNSSCSYYGQPYITENGQHWQVCSVCGLEGKKSPCTSWYGAQSNGNGTHSLTCDTCKNAVTTGCTYGSYTYTGSAGHYKACTACGGKSTVEKHVMVYTGTDGKETHKVSCKDCGYVSNSYENCTYSGSYVQGDTQHWKVCDKCKTKGTMSNHSGSVTSNNNGKHTVNCTICNKNAVVDCTMSKWINNSWEDNHYRECTTNGCDYKEIQEHKDFVFEQYSSNQHKKVCGVCGDYEYVDCTKKYTDNNDGKTHTVTCNDCKNTNTAEKHSFNYSTKKCVCGAERHDHKWAVSGSGNKITLSCTETVGVCSGELGELTITASNSGYNGEAKPATVTITEGSHLKELYPSDYSYTIKYYEKKNGTYSSTYNTPTKAGEYKAEVTLTQNGTSATASVEYQIEKVDLSAVVSADDVNVVYDGYKHSITVDKPDNASVQYSTDNTNWYPYTNYVEFTDVGEYTVYYKVTMGGWDADNYNTKEATGSAKVNITQANLADILTVTGTDKEFTYSRYDHTDDSSYTYHSIGMDVQGADSLWSSYLPMAKYNYIQYKVKYSTDDGATWSETNPTFVDAGEYTVKYRVDAYKNNSTTIDSNITGITGENKVTIKQAELPFDSLVGYQGPYDGFTHYLFGYAVEDEDDGYLDFTYWPSYLLEELKYDFSWTDENGDAKTSSVEGKDSFLDYETRQNLPGYTKQNVAKVSDNDEVGHIVTVTISGKNYITETFTYEVKIGRGLARGEDVTVPYDGKEHYIKNYMGDWFGDHHPAKFVIEYRVNKDDPTYTDDDTWLPASQEPGQIEVGSKLIDWKVTFDSDGDYRVGDSNRVVGDGNGGPNNTEFGTPEIIYGTNKVTVTGIPLTVTANDNTITYGEDAAANGYTVTGFIDGEDESVLSGTVSYDFKSTAPYAVGTYQDEIIPKGLTSNNYSITYVNGDLTVVKKEIGLDWGTLVFDYDGTHKQPTVTATGLVDGESCELIVELYEKDGTTPVTETKEIGEYIIKVVGISNPNYKLPEDVTANYSIAENKPPVIEKIEDGKTYYDDTDFTVTDDDLDKVTVDGKEVTPDANGNYNLPADNKEHTVVATDKGGNSTTVKVTVYKTYTVKYVASGKVVSEQMVAYGKDAVAPKVPELKGYTGKWDKDGKNIVADTTITAVYYDNNGVAKTGDDSNPLLWAGMMLTAAAGVVGIVMYLKKKKEE